MTTADALQDCELQETNQDALQPGIVTPSSIGHVDGTVNLVDQQTNVAEQHVVDGDNFHAEGNITIINCPGPHNNCHLEHADHNDNVQKTGLAAASHFPYKRLCLKIIKHFKERQEQLEDLIYYVIADYDSGCGISSGKQIDDAKTLISELEKRHLMGPRNILYIQRLLHEINETGLAEEVEQYGKEMGKQCLQYQKPTATNSEIATLTTPVEIILQGDPNDYNFGDVDQLRDFISRIGIPSHTVSLKGVGNGSVILIFQVPLQWRISETEVIDVKIKLHGFLSDNCDWLFQHQVTGFHVPGYPCSHLSSCVEHVGEKSVPEYKRTSSGNVTTPDSPEIPREPPKMASLILEVGDEYESFNFDITQGISHAGKDHHLSKKNKIWSQEDEAYVSVEHVDGLPIASEDERRYSRFGLGSLPEDGSDCGLFLFAAVSTKPPLTNRSTADGKPIPAPKQSVRQLQLPPPQPPPAKEPILPAPSAEENCKMAHQAIQNIMNENPEASKTEIVIQTLNFVAKFCDAHGGYLEVGSKKATLFIPPFALDCETLIYVQIEESYCLVGDQGHQIAPVVHCGEPGTQFNTPVILSFYTPIQDTRYFDVIGIRKQTPKAERNDNDGKITTKGVRKETVQSANEDPAYWHETTEKEGQVMTIENGECMMMVNNFADDTLFATPTEKHFGKIGVVAFTSPVMKKGNIFDIRVWMSNNPEVLREDERREMEDNQAKPLYHFCPTLWVFEDGGDVTIEITNLERKWSIYPNSSPRTQSVKLPNLRYMHDHDDQGIRESLVFRIHPTGQFVPSEMVTFDIELFQPEMKYFGIRIPVCVEPEPEPTPEAGATKKHGQTLQFRMPYHPSSRLWVPPKESIERLEQSLSHNNNWKPLAAWLHLDVCNIEGFPNPATIMLAMVFQKHAINGGEHIRKALEELNNAMSTGKLGAGLREASDIVREILGNGPAAQPADSVAIRQPTEEVWPVSMSPIEVNEYRFNYRTLQSDPLKTPDTSELHYDQPYIRQTGLAQDNALASHLGDSYEDFPNELISLVPSSTSDGLLDVDMSEGRRLSDIIREEHQDPPY